MEQHPVPRNISSFQFHLVGDMTIRQFIYLAGGVFIGFLVIKFTPFPNILKWIIAAIPALSGAAFAFLPIAERPLDKWIVAFLRSINSPTQYLWQKDAYIPDILLKNYATTVRTAPQNHMTDHEDAKRKLESYLSTLPSTPHQTISNRETNYVNKTLELFSSVEPSFPASAPSGGISGFGQSGLIPPVINQSNIPIRPVKIDREKPVLPTIKTVPIGKIQNNITLKPAIIPTETVNKPTFASASAGKPDDAKAMPGKQDDDKLTAIIAEKQKLETELQKLKDELVTKNEKPHSASASTSAKAPADKSWGKKDIIIPVLEAEKIPPTIKTVTPKTAVNEIGIPKLPQVPNIIMGIIKDMQGKQLPNIILTIKDTHDMPHRALKTNRLGQFSTATPLQNGTYHIEAEDPLKRYVFDIAEIILTGKVFLPIEIDAKGEKELMREKLTKEIFGLPSQAGNQGTSTL